MPHLTIAKMDPAEEARRCWRSLANAGSAYTGSRTVRIESLTFVKGVGERWVDLAKTPLGGASR